MAKKRKTPQADSLNKLADIIDEAGEIVSDNITNTSASLKSSIEKAGRKATKASKDMEKALAKTTNFKNEITKKSTSAVKKFDESMNKTSDGFNKIADSLEEMASSADETIKEIEDTIGGAAEDIEKKSEQAKTSEKKTKQASEKIKEKATETIRTNSKNVSEVIHKIKAINMQILDSLPPTEREIELLKQNTKEMKEQYKKTNDYTATGKEVINKMNDIISSVSQNTDLKNLMTNLGKIRNQKRLVQIYEKESEQKDNLLRQLSEAELRLTNATIKRAGLLGSKSKMSGLGQALGIASGADFMSAISGGNVMATRMGRMFDTYRQNKKEILGNISEHNVSSLKGYRSALEKEASEEPSYSPRLSSKKIVTSSGRQTGFSVSDSIGSVMNDIKDGLDRFIELSEKSIEHLAAIRENTNIDMEAAYEARMKGARTFSSDSEGKPSGAIKPGEDSSVFEKIIGAFAGFSLLKGIGGKLMSSGLVLTKFLAKAFVAVEAFSTIITEAENWINSDGDWTTKFKQSVSKLLLPALGTFLGGLPGMAAGFLLNEFGGDKLVREFTDTLQYKWTEDVLPGLQLLRNSMFDWIGKIGNFFSDVGSEISIKFTEYLGELYMAASRAVALIPGQEGLADSIEKKGVDLLSDATRKRRTQIKAQAERNKTVNAVSSAEIKKVVEERNKTIEENNKALSKEDSKPKGTGDAIASLINSAASFLGSRIPQSGGNVTVEPLGTPSTTPSTGNMEEKAVSVLQSQGITGNKEISNILAQIKAESNFVPRSENLNYSPERLLKVFPGKFSDLEDAKAVVAGGQEAIGNRIYGGRMGNKEDEGFKYRGRGLIQLTGKDNYLRYGKMIGEDLVANPDLANNPDVALKIAAAYYKDRGSRSDLSSIMAVNKMTGYVGSGSGGAEDQKRTKLASGYEARLLSGNFGTSPILADKVAPDFERPVVAVGTETEKKNSLDLASSGSSSTVINNINNSAPAPIGGNPPVSRQAPRGSEPSILGHQNSDYSGSYS